MVCAQCHSFRDIYVNDFAAGDDYYDHFLPVLEYNLPDTDDPAYWPDNRTRRFSNDAFGLVAERVLFEGRGYVRRLPRAGARDRDRTKSAATPRR